MDGLMRATGKQLKAAQMLQVTRDRGRWRSIGYRSPRGYGTTVRFHLPGLRGSAGRQKILDRLETATVSSRRHAPSLAERLQMKFLRITSLKSSEPETPPEWSDRKSDSRNLSRCSSRPARERSGGMLVPRQKSYVKAKSP
ncbi:uncharacterized protein LOC143033246 [Oratosquilla oratoria]|uniref:uncharacterized protein LOC143033246 n=1 Tax=Oratosquilla oratoria TaxID=337810 RepID=UPI003F770E07